MSEADNPYSAEGDSLLLDPDLYDADTYDIPDPGLLKEKNGEVALPGPPPAPRAPPPRPHDSRPASLGREFCLPRCHTTQAVPGPCAGCSLQSQGCWSTG